MTAPETWGFRMKTLIATLLISFLVNAVAKAESIERGDLDAAAESARADQVEAAKAMIQMPLYIDADSLDSDLLASNSNQ